MRLSSLGLAVLFLLCGCDRIDAWLHPKPADTTVTEAPTPPLKAPVQLYPGQAAPVMQVRGDGDCAAARTCYVFSNGNWQALDPKLAGAVPLLSVQPPAESAYSDSLWRPVGTGNRFVLLNDDAGQQNFQSWLFDGQRIGLMDPSRTTYITAYAIEDGKTLAAHSVCTRGDSPADEGDTAKAGCALRVAPGLYLTGDEGDVFIANGTAWLLYQKRDGGADLVDLFAVLARHQTLVCLPGLILDTTGATAGPPEKALSPDIFVSRLTDPDTDDKRRDAAMRACYPPAVKGTP